MFCFYHFCLSHLLYTFAFLGSFGSGGRTGCLANGRSVDRSPALQLIFWLNPKLPPIYHCVCVFNKSAYIKTAPCEYVCFWVNETFSRKHLLKLSIKVLYKWQSIYNCFSSSFNPGLTRFLLLLPKSCYRLAILCCHTEFLFLFNRHSAKHKVLKYDN